MRLRQLADSLLATLVAPPCAICNAVLDAPLDGAVCARCWSSLSVTPCAFSLEGIAAARAIGLFEGMLRDVLHALKYDHRRSVAPRLAQVMAQAGAALVADADFAVPVPLHRTRLSERGFNQADDLARGLGLPVRRVLARTRATTPQVALSGGARRQNVRNAFAVAPPHALQRLRALVEPPQGGTTSLTGQVIVLVDDVATTGATLEACARALTMAGAREVRALTAARVVS